jgi:electron transport complex protein RnfG
MVREYTRMIVVLTIISLLSGGVLAETYRFTQPKIEKVREERLAQSVFDVVPGATGFEDIGTDGFNLFRVFDDSGAVLGYAFVAESAGFQGTIRMMVGIDENCTRITGLMVLEHLETPGLGARIIEPGFRQQFIGKSVTDKFQVNEDVDAVTGATISSNAVANGLKDGIERVRTIIESQRRGE